MRCIYDWWDKLVQVLPLQLLGDGILLDGSVLCAGTLWDGLRDPFLISEIPLTDLIACNMHGTGNLDLKLGILIIAISSIAELR